MDSIQKQELDDARTGTLYFLSNLRVDRSTGFDAGLVSNFVLDTSIVGDLKNASVKLLKTHDKGKAVVDGLTALSDPIYQLMNKFTESINKRMLALYGEASGVVEWVAEFGSWLASTFTGSLVDLIPGWGYVQSANGIYEGIKRSVTNAIKWLDQVYSGWGVEILEGGPSIMSQAISRHSAAGIAGGPKDLAISSVKLGMQAGGDALAGVGAIASAITGILQRIVNLIGYCIQRYLLNKVIDQATNQYRINDTSDSAHDRFSKWFRNACSFTPVVAALVMCSGYTAHSYRFLALINNKGQVIGQKEFDDGIKYTEKLKDLSKNYIREYAKHYRVVFSAPESKTINNTLKSLIA